MATAVRGWQALRVYLEMIKIEHSIFALPFALVGMMWGSASLGRGLWPGPEKFWLIVLAMVSCRAAAMAFNRIVDRHFDAANPRTAIRALPAGLLRLRDAHLFFGVSVAVFLIAAAALNPLALALSPVALLFTLGYSLTKRFTWLCHYVLGLSLGIAPAAAWIAVTGALHPSILPLTLAVMFWTAGFDILYALQDDEFDRANGLNSIPSRFGRRRAILVSRGSHVAAVGLLALAMACVDSGPLAYAGAAFAAGLLAYQQSLVRANDLSKLQLAFFTLNGYIAVGVFAFVLLDGWL